VKLDSDPKPHGKHASLKTRDDSTVQDAHVAWKSNGNVREKEPQQVADEKLSNTAQPPPWYVKTSCTDEKVSHPAAEKDPQHDSDLSLVTAHTCWNPGDTRVASRPGGIVKMVKSPVDADEQYGTDPHPGSPNQLMELASFVHHRVVVLARKSTIGDAKNPAGFVVTLVGSSDASLRDTWHEKLEADDGSTTHVRLGPVASRLPGSDGNVNGS
jgi:hypothetical protein